MSISELKAHLKERGISTAGALERQELIDLALAESQRGKLDVEVAPSLSDHLVEC